MKTVEIDGERFVLTIPEFHSLKKLCQENEEKCYTIRSGLVGKTLTWAREQEHFEHFILNMFHDGSCVGVQAATNQQGEQSNASLTINWRPVLVPIDKYGFFDDFLTKRYKNGATILFGSVEVSGKPFHPLDLPTEKPIDSIRLCDSVENRSMCLQWVVWNGLLICTRCLAKNICMAGFIETELGMPTPKLPVKGLKF